jgi:hypothetical protein
MNFDEINDNEESKKSSSDSFDLEMFYKKDKEIKLIESHKNLNELAGNSKTTLE